MKITLLKDKIKNTSLTNNDYKKTAILPLRHRLMHNKARFMHKILSGQAPIYLVKRVSVNLYSRNYSRKLNVPMPRLDLFKSSLKYSGPTLWNSLPVALTESSIVSVFKHRLSTHIIFPRYNDAPYFLEVQACFSIVIKVLFLMHACIMPPAYAPDLYSFTC